MPIAALAYEFSDAARPLALLCRSEDYDGGSPAATLR